MNELSIDEFKTLAKKLYLAKDRKPLILLGPPGVGKTEGVYQLAQELARELNLKFIEYDESSADEIMADRSKYFVFLEFRLYECEPSDFIGIPRDVNGFIVYKPLRWAQVFSTGAGLLNLDEITNIQRPDLQAAMYKLFERRAGFIKFHPDVIITATGNRPEDSAIATMLPAPLINRVRVFRIRAPALKEWINYMYETRNDWDKRVAAFLARFGQFFLEKPQDIETLDQFATPRAWTALADVSQKIDIEELESLASATVGARAGQHFVTFCKLDVPNPDEFIKDPSRLSELDVDRRYLATLQLSTMLDQKLQKDVSSALETFRKLLFYLNSNDREFLTLLILMLPPNSAKKIFMKMINSEEFKGIAKHFINVFMKVKKLEGR